MKKQILMGIAFCFLIVVIAGCTGGSGVRARSYVADKERVDQEMDDGNYGYFSGKPVPEDRSEYKKTRKMYVLEFTKDPEEPEIDMSLPPRTKYVSSPPPPQRERKRMEPEPLVLPNFDDDDYYEEETRSRGAAVEYTIQKNDTLQKISKKFYDSYSKWPKIYDANRDVIEDPNRIKPGKVIRIPAE